MGNPTAMNPRVFSWIFIAVIALTAPAWADHVVVTGGPALREWEELRVKEKQHDRWWGNFVRASTLSIDSYLKTSESADEVIWMVFKPALAARGVEDSKPYTNWIEGLARKRNVQLLWFSSRDEFLDQLNNRPRRSVESFDYFGHSNRYAFMFDYGSDIMAASTSWLHQNHLKEIRRSVFARKARCKSWGCHTGESMSKVWKKEVKTTLIGAKGATNYSKVGHGQMPSVSGEWVD